jgi:hypothetical protein
MLESLAAASLEAAGVRLQLTQASVMANNEIAAPGKCTNLLEANCKLLRFMLPPWPVVDFPYETGEHSFRIRVIDLLRHQVGRWAISFGMGGLRGGGLNE